jgi:cobalt/nickel transport protein
MKYILFLVLFVPLYLSAHFQMLLPNHAVVEEQKDSTIHLMYKFAHPFEGDMMNMVKPSEAGVFFNGKKHDFLSSLHSHKENNLTYWTSEYKVKEPNVYQFYVDPKPYFEPAEEKFIRHQTKVIVDAYDSGEGWDKPIGLKAEIIPYTRPYGLYAGNLFRGKVLYKGKPAKNVTVEVEIYNTKGYKAPTSSHVTQVVKTDENGIFSFAMPKSGWWGFAALIDDDVKISKDGKNYPVELGAVLWVKCEDMK